MKQEKKALNVSIGARIQAARESAGLTQERLAELTDRSTQFISTIERGVAGPSLETIVKICDVLSVSSDYVLLGREPVPSADFIAAKLSDLSEAQLRAAGDMIDKLLELLRVTQEVALHGSDCMQ